MATFSLYRAQFTLRQPLLVVAGVLLVAASILLVIAGRLSQDARRYGDESIEAPVVATRVVPAAAQTSTVYELTYRAASATGPELDRTEAVPVALWEVAAATSRVRLKAQSDGGVQIWQPASTTTIVILAVVGVALLLAAVSAGVSGIRAAIRVRKGLPDPPSWGARQLGRLSFWTLFGSIWFSVGLPFILLTAFFVWEDWRLSAHAGTATGLVLTKEITRHSIRYRFESADGRVREGEDEVPEATWTALVERAPVSIQYLPGQPVLHRIAGTNQRGKLVIFGGVGLLIGGAGALIIRADWRRQRRVNRLRAGGIRALATVVEIGTVRLRVNREQVWRIRYEYRDSGQGTRRGAAYVTEEEAARWSLGDQAAILMDPAQPQSSVWIGEATESPA